jgi:hypothetical protein
MERAGNASRACAGPEEAGARALRDGPLYEAGHSLHGRNYPGWRQGLPHAQLLREQSRRERLELRPGEGCDTGGLIVQDVEQWGDPTDLDAAGHFDESFGHGLKGTVRGAKASGVLVDTDDCGSKTFKWSARRTP